MQIENVYSLHRPTKAGKTESMVLSFLKEDAWGIVMPYDDALVVTVIVANLAIHIGSWLIMEARLISCIGQPLSRWAFIETGSNHSVPLSWDSAKNKSNL